MGRIRRHLTYSNVMVTILAFIVLTGGTAVALNGANTVQSDDLGPGAQVKAPDVAANAVNGSDILDNQVSTLDVRNDSLSGGGLAAADLRPSSVGSSEVAADSLDGGNINESSLGIVPDANQLDGIDSSGFLSSGSVQKLLFDAPASDTNPATSLATVGPYTIKAQCLLTMDGEARLRLFANGPQGQNYLWGQRYFSNTNQYITDSGIGSVEPNTDWGIAPAATASSGGYTQAAGTVMLETGSVVVQVDFNGVAYHGAPGLCHLVGTATAGM